MPGTRRALLHRIAVAQQEGRAPSLVAAVVRDGRTVWSGARTSVEGEAPDGEEQYRIGSITKTFTAVLVLRLRDEGLLDLAGPLERHLPGTGVGDVTVVDLLAHRAGLAAETPGPWWERTPGSLRPDLGDVLGERPLIHPVGRRFHYSNPGYALLGALVEKLRGAPWADVLRREVLEPLGLRRTTAEPVAPHAGGWAVHPWADVMQPEPLENLGVMAPAGQLWSTTGDLVDAVQPGGLFHTLPTALDRPLLFIAGGVPVRRDGRLIGAVGVGGGAPELDHGFATAAVASLA